MLLKIDSTVELLNGIEMPRLGLGVWRAKDGQETENAVLTALEAGYRSIDTASMYGNEQGVGRAIRASGVPREQVFVTTKVWNNEQGYDNTARSGYDSEIGSGASHPRERRLVRLRAGAGRHESDRRA